jgi:hypothetical protein
LFSVMIFNKEIERLDFNMRGIEDTPQSHRMPIK